MTWGWNIENWKTHDRFEEADKACKHACGLGLEEAWEDTSGCSIRVGFGGHHWMSPETIAEAIAFLYFDFIPYTMEE